MKKKLMAEFMGTYFLVFVGTGAVVVNDITDSLTHFGIAVTFGLAVAILIYTFAHLSGAHFNPAVTMGFFIHKDIQFRETVYYIISQILGGLAASGTLLLLFGNVANLGATTPYGSWTQSFLLEFILTFLLMMVILGSAVYGKASKLLSGLAIGGTVFLAAFFGGPISGASLNPARSIGPAIMSSTIQYLWIYIFATALGALVATYVCKFMHEDSSGKEKTIIINHDNEMKIENKLKKVKV